MMAASNRRAFATRAWWAALLLVTFTMVGSARADEPQAAQDTAEEAQPAPAAASTDRQAIIDRLRCEGGDPSDCLIPEPVFDGETPSEALAAGSDILEPVDEADLKRLLDAVNKVLAVAEEEKIGAAGAELAATRYQELQFFGVTDHYVDPPYDYYTDPIQSVSRVPMLYLDQIDPRDFDIPLVVNERVQDWMVYFLTRGRKHYTKWLGRKVRYEPLITQALAERGLPQDLIYQSMIESGFSPYAYSWAKAAGIWQFIPGTGRQYGMQIDWWVDQRRDPYVATVAALDYLEYLYGMFDNWLLASAAYNAGEGKIGRAIQRYGTRDFFELCQGDYLKPETKDYVPKIMAAAILGKYPDRYGLTAEIPAILEPWEFETVNVPEATDMELIAELTGTDEEHLLEMNPSLRRWCTPPGVDDFSVRIPVGSAEGFHEKLAAIPVEDRLTFKRYKVGKGDTLSKIAAKFGVSVDSVLKMNTIRNRNRISVGQYLVIPVRSNSTRSRDVVHTVDKGESLSALAMRYGVSVSDIKSWNKLSGSTIHVGQQLKIHMGGAPADAKAAATTEPTTAVADKGETENKGDEAGDAVADAAAPEAAAPAAAPAPTKKSLKALADTAEKAIADAAAAEAAEAAKAAEPEPVKVAAAIKKPRKDKPAAKRNKRNKKKAAKGEKLVHEVTRGQSLSVLASKYDVSISKLKSWNNLRNDTIYVGQKLSVYPGPESEIHRVSYKVKKGDTLWEIARDHGVEVADLQKWNEMGKRSTISIGQSLTIYSGSGSTRSHSPRTVTHKVKQGDSLWTIARHYNVTVEAIKKWNGLRRDTVYIGQSLSLKLN